MATSRIACATTRPTCGAQSPMRFHQRGLAKSAHGFRRAFGNRLKDLALRELKELGSREDRADAIRTYLQPDHAQCAALDRF
jgi:hypothetical protein